MIRALGSTLAFLLSAAVSAQSEGPQSIHWAYSAFFGTGAYETDAGAEALVISIRPSRTWREATLDDHGSRTVGVKFRLPIAVGIQDFDAAAPVAALRFDNVSTLSVVPGAEVEILISARWSLKPIAYLGWGTEMHGDSSAWIYWTGVKSRLLLGSNDAFEWALVNSLIYVGYRSDDTPHGNVLPLSAAFEFSRPLGMKKLGGEQVRLHWHVGYTDYLNEVKFAGAELNTSISVTEEWELGAAFSTGDRQLQWWRLRLDRLGLAYRFSDDRGVRGISVVFSSWFDR